MRKNESDFCCVHLLEIRGFSSELTSTSTVPNELEDVTFDAGDLADEAPFFEPTPQEDSE